MPISREIPAAVTGRAPVKIWAEKIKPEAELQLLTLAGSPYVVGHVAVMPDCHPASGVTIGTVFTTKTAILPTAIGVDVGCGVLAQPLTGIAASELTSAFRRELHTEVKARLPMGGGSHAEPQAWSGFERDAGYSDHVAELVAQHGPWQLGTLGGGNHFLELAGDEADRVWLLIHSGSRGVGARIAGVYAELARAINAKLDPPSPTALPAIPVETPVGQACLNDLLWAQQYADVNRWRMGEAFVEEFARLAKRRLKRRVEADPATAIHTQHNFISAEAISGETAWVHRKGVAFAGLGTLGVVPGSMATGAYIVRGLGCAESLNSCAHGAGRLLSRGQAHRHLTLEQFKHKMRGIVADVREEFLDEAPNAYKPLDEVMARQSDLVEPIHRLTPLLNLKGSDRERHVLTGGSARDGEARRHYDRARDRDSVVERRRRERRQREPW